MKETKASLNDKFKKKVCWGAVKVFWKKNKRSPHFNKGTKIRKKYP